MEIRKITLAEPKTGKPNMFSFLEHPRLGLPILGATLNKIRESAIKGTIASYEGRLLKVREAIEDKKKKIKELEEKRENLKICLLLARKHLMELENLPTKREKGLKMGRLWTDFLSRKNRR